MKIIFKKNKIIFIPTVHSIPGEESPDSNCGPELLTSCISTSQLASHQPHMWPLFLCLCKHTYGVAVWYVRQKMSRFKYIVSRDLYLLFVRKKTGNGGIANA